MPEPGKGGQHMKPIILAPLVALVLTGGSAGAYLWVTSEGSGEEATVAQPTSTPTPAPTEQTPATATPAPTAEAEVQVVRWVNVTVAVPQDSGLTVTQGFWGPESDPPALFIRSRENGSSVIVIDADTGKVIVDHIEPEDRGAVDEVLQTVSVSPLDRSMASWPYSGEPPNIPRQKWGNITFIPPDPAAGISITFQAGDGPGSSSTSLHVNNGRSAFGINTATGDVYWETARIAPEDKEAFDSFLSAIHYVGP